MGTGRRPNELPPEVFIFVYSLRLRVFLMTTLVVLTAFTLLSSPKMSWQSSYSIDWPRDRMMRGVPKGKIDFDGPVNETLLTFSAIEPNQEQELNQIQELLDLSLDAGHKFQGIRKARRSDYQDPDDRQQTNPAALTRRKRVLPGLSKSIYLPYWPKFRQLLNSWVLGKRFDPKVMQGLVSAVKTPIDKQYKSVSHQKYKTCAVVGNSGILLNSDYGSIIDSHEMVMRLNNARTASFERWVGSKTTLAFVNSNVLHKCSRRPTCFCHPYGENVPMVMYICQAVHFMDVAMCRDKHKAPLLVTDPRFDSLTARLAKWYSAKRFVEENGRSISEWDAAHDGLNFHYSSGMQAVMLALGICDQVSLFGFGKLDKTKHHYHTSQGKELGLHDYEAEYKLYDDLVNKRMASIPFLNEAGIDIPPMQIFR